VGRDEDALRDVIVAVGDGDVIGGLGFSGSD
jgi:hypothetical protein